MRTILLPTWRCSIPSLSRLGFFFNPSHVSCRGVRFDPFAEAMFSTPTQPYGRRIIMSYLSLQFKSVPQNLSSACRMRRETERDVPTAPDAVESTNTGTGSGVGGFQLPSGIVSLDHWLDLNA